MARNPRPGDSLHQLVGLFHRRWGIRIVDELARSRGAKFVTLANRLGVSRDTLRATLDDLIELGWVTRNPGHGHPMRPEYVLTAGGRRLAPAASRLLEAVRRLRVEPIASRKWTLPVAYVLGHAPRRFSELRESLDGITPRALTLALKEMQAFDLVRRDVFDDYPPTTLYRLEHRARRLRDAIGAVARAC